MAKKMLLVDPASLPSGIISSILPSSLRPSVTDKILGRLDQSISDVLNSDLPDDVKAKRYLASLRESRYLETPKPADPMESILKSVPTEERIKAKRILSHIKPSVRWSDEGELVHDSEVVPDSSLAELLTEASKKETKDDPIGWNEFAEELKKVNTPHSFVANDKLRRLIRVKRRKRTLKKDKIPTLTWSS